jgi:anti-sigma-K factor RskA
MNYLLPDRLDRLAREYVLGTLTGRARRRFERVLAQTPAAHQAVAGWQARFSVLAAGVPPLQPREAAWQGLERRLFAPAPAPAPAAGGWWRRLLSGPAWGGALAGVLLCTVVLRMQPGWVGLETHREALPESYVGLLLDQAGKPTLLASSRRHGREMSLKVLQPVAVPAGKVAQLWAMPNEGAPFPVAVLPPLPAKGSVTMALPDSSEALFFKVGRLAIALQDTPARPGDPPPVAPALSGFCVKLW